MISPVSIPELDDIDLFGDIVDTAAVAVVPTQPDPSDPVDAKQVCPFTVVVDTREQAPFHFLNIDPFTVVPLRTDTALKTGDYSIVGLESRLTIERKSISDLLGSITADRQRFESEMVRMAEIARHPDGGFAAVVVEGELSEVLRHSRGKTQVRTDSVLGTVDAWSIRYGVHWRFCVGGRRGAEIQTLKLLHQFWRQEQHRVKEAVKEKGTV